MIQNVPNWHYLHLNMALKKKGQIKVEREMKRVSAAVGLEPPPGSQQPPNGQKRSKNGQKKFEMAKNTLKNNLDFHKKMDEKTQTTFQMLQCP